MDFIKEKRELLLFLLSIILFIVIIVLGCLLYTSNNELVIEEQVLSTNNQIIEEVMDNEIKVDIKGAVKMPGIYSVSLDKRVNDVINLAGGLLENADTININLSEKVYDEMVIIINYKIDNITDDNVVVNNINSKISINKANLEQLKTLPGIGESKALAIISYRENVGKFKSIEQLLEVKGIGESIFAKIKENITL